MFTFEVSFNSLSVPTSWNRMSKIFKDSDSLGKSDGKKWSQIWKLLLIKSVKLHVKKFFTDFLHWFTPFKHFLAPTSQRVEKNSFKGCKIAAQFLFLLFFSKFCLTSRIFLVLMLLSVSVKRYFVSHMRDFF